MLLSDFNCVCSFLESPPHKNLKKIRPVGAVLIHADERTDGKTEGHDEAKRRVSLLMRKRMKITAAHTDSF